jgi:hypothetical protein
MLLAGLLIVGSLVSVVVGDDLLTSGQVRLSSIESQLKAGQSALAAGQVQVAQLEAPQVVVNQAEHQLGLAAAAQVVYLPQVSLSTPLPVPNTSPVATGTSSTGPSSR